MSGEQPRGARAFLTFRKAPSKGSYIAVASASVILSLVVWQFVVSVGLMPADFFPPPLQVLGTGIVMFKSQGFGYDVLASASRIFVAFFFSALLAIPLGLFMSTFKLTEAIIEPLIDFIRYVPVPALGPIFILWAGIGESSKFLILFFGTFFQLVLLIMDDADNIPAEFFDSARMLGASTPLLFRDVLIPAIMPQLYDRLRVTLGWCWTYLVIAELLAVERGVGHTLKEAQRFNAADQMFVCLIVLGFIGLFTDYSAKIGYKRLFPYAAKADLAAR